MMRSRFAGWAIVALAVTLITPPTSTLALDDAETSPGANALDLSRWEGQVVLVDFWASWCGPCASAFPFMAAMTEKYGEQGFVVVSVNLDQDRALAERFLAGRQAPFEHLFDPEGRIAEHYGVEIMPTSLLFDRQGRLAFVEGGFLEKKTATYEQRIAALLSGTHSGQAVVDRGPGNSEGRLRPWERDLLAQRHMSLDCDPLDFAIDDHIYFSKEASAGGRGFGGGGCGCN